MCVNSVIIHVFTEMNYRCNYMQVFKKYISTTYKLVLLEARRRHKYSLTVFIDENAGH